MSKHPRTQGFSKRELQVLILTGLDFTQEEIAGLLFIAYGTVKSHLQNMFNRCGVNSAAAVLFIAITSGYLRPGFASFRVAATVNGYFWLN